MVFYNVCVEAHVMSQDSSQLRVWKWGFRMLRIQNMQLRSQQFCVNCSVEMGNYFIRSLGGTRCAWQASATLQLQNCHMNIMNPITRKQTGRQKVYTILNIKWLIYIILLIIIIFLKLSITEIYKNKLRDYSFFNILHYLACKGGAISLIRILIREQVNSLMEQGVLHAKLPYKQGYVVKHFLMTSNFLIQYIKYLTQLDRNKRQQVVLTVIGQ
ncbi:Hypothetical_protein [Hexamita inflata]|uniref:Hypothetical_protein n=1 Tax=Hexamita inflata TaxID=28002 RepID=A0AA86QAT8_9EUKA|nr:Hypothetical protein HINF_LOCUS40272 [Hexamita inflata]